MTAISPRSHIKYTIETPPITKVGSIKFSQSQCYVTSIVIDGIERLATPPTGGIAWLDLRGDGHVWAPDRALITRHGIAIEINNDTDETQEIPSVEFVEG